MPVLPPQAEGAPSERPERTEEDDIPGAHQAKAGERRKPREGEGHAERAVERPVEPPSAEKPPRHEGSPGHEGREQEQPPGGRGQVGTARSPMAFEAEHREPDGRRHEPSQPREHGGAGQLRLATVRSAVRARHPAATRLGYHPRGRPADTGEEPSGPRTISIVGSGKINPTPASSVAFSRSTISGRKCQGNTR